MPLEELHARYGPSLEKAMRSAVQPSGTRQGPLFGILQYHLGWLDAELRECEARSGKRVRPVLCLLVCEGCGGNWEEALPAATAVELLHNFTLIHDDIEDRDTIRRGRPTVWSVWGQPQAINAGDTLFALSQLAMLQLSDRGAAPKVVTEAVRLFNHTCVRLTTGQHLDIEFEGRDDVSVDDYLAMIERKTAALISCSCELGALTAGASLSRREHVRAFGRHSGLAFQMMDDLLGIWGDSEETGKAVGADVVRRKKTLPLLHGLERNSELSAMMGRDSLGADAVVRAQRLLEETGSREYTEQLARKHHKAALVALDNADLRHPAAQQLRDLAEQLLRRRR